jgi:plastocyanin
MRKLALSLTAFVLLVPLADAATFDPVKLKDNFFKPDRVEIAKGDKVVWRWKGDNTHNVAGKKPGSNNIAFASEFKTEGKYSHKFGKVGTWKILCETHPVKMRMKVVVSGPVSGPGY